jgi:hypothetical protein
MLKFIFGSHVNASLVLSSVCITASQETKIGPRRRLSSRYVFTVRIVRRLGMLTPFLQDKDIGKYNQALAQVLDGISTKAAFIKVRKNCRASFYCGSDIHSFHESAQPRMSSPGWRLGSPSGSSMSKVVTHAELSGLCFKSWESIPPLQNVIVISPMGDMKMSFFFHR